ncbi:hypothetical protein V6N13_053892 [Hibiscus sabdariffa]
MASPHLGGAIRDDADSLETLCMVQSATRDHGTLGLVLHIKELCGRNSMINFSHANRKENYAADRMMCLIILDDFDVCTFDAPSPSVNSLILFEIATAMLVVLLCLPLFLHALALNQEGLFLQRVRQSLSDPSNALSSWDQRDPSPCNWRGVSCHSPAGPVHSLDLSHLQLAGPFPLFLCRLPSLRFISLANNSINSYLPPQISTCQSLTTLDLSLNLISGPLPPSLAEIPTLRNLILVMNNFSGPIPPTFAYFQSIQVLNLAGNLLNGTVPAFLSNVSTLKQLYLGYNSFSPGFIPSQFGNLTNLEQLFLADCNLVGQIPSSLGRLTRLQNLDLSHNRLTGSIPSSISELKSIEQIEIYENFLSGVLPLTLGNLTTLKRLDVSGNEFTGTIPTELCGLQLESLNLFENRLEGTLPESITSSKYLHELKLYNNNLSGTLPSQLGENSSLQLLDLSYNQFSGEIPGSLCAKGKLEDILLMNNSFSGEIPESIGKCQSLGRIRFKNNLFSGQVPDGLWGLPRVFLLELAENSFSGQISKTISTAHNLSVLSISNNQFSGSLPDEIGSLGTLVEISASGNGFTGQIPESLVKLRQLVTLDLSGNKIEGGIPDGIKGWMNLNELNLANNKLSGGIPTDIGSLPVLNYLDLSGNSFSGKIPIELQNLKLNVLNLSNNQLSGELPPFFDKEMYRNSFLGNPGLCGDFEGLCPKIGQSKNRSHAWILRSIFVLASLGFVVGLLWFYMKYGSFRKNKRRVTISKWRSFHKIGFSEFEIVDRLFEENVIGSGASGKVYKVVLGNGDTVAVKKLNRGVKKDDSLNAEFGAKVADFGVAKIVKRVGEGAEPMSVIAGSYGYIAPEYAYTLRVNEKSDIYSFGVVILELVTGKPPNDPEFGDKDVVKWVCVTFDQKGADQVIDPRLDLTYKEEICRVLDIGLLCTNALPVNRPSMRNVVKLLQEAVGRTS